MRTLIIVLALLVLSCEKQPLTFEPDTKVSQSVPTGQIEPQIDTLFSSWKEFHNEEYQYPVVELYKHQLDNGYFGLSQYHTLLSNHIKGADRLGQYKSITLSFQLITTGLAVGYPIDFEIAHDATNPNTYQTIACTIVHVNPNDTCLVSWTVSLDSLVFGIYSFTYRDITDIGIGYASEYNPKLEHNQPYYAYMSELLVTVERREDTPGKGE